MNNMDFTKEECITLIEFVQANDLLYNPTNQFYKSRVEREAAWNNIAETINKPAALCKKKWRHLRDHFLRGHLKRGNGVSNWVYYKPLKFLEFLRPTRPNNEKTEDGDEEDDVFSETEEVHAKRLKTDAAETEAYYDNNNDVGLIPVKVITEESTSDDISIEDIQSDRDTDMFMVEISNRIKRLPHQLQDIAKVNILAHITELELQHNGQC